MLIDAAIGVLAVNYHDDAHTVGAAVLCASGAIHVGVNLEGYGPCAEPIALGSAISAGERGFAGIVAVTRDDAGYRLLPPCGTCRQLLLRYAPAVDVLLPLDGDVVSRPIGDLLPIPYTE